jgi:hypothetical protein
MSAVDRLHRKASLLQAQIVALRAKALQSNDAIGWTDILCRPYFEMLEQLYSEEMAFAKALDFSDLLVHAEGPAISHDAPRLQIVEGFFRNIRAQVLRVTKAIAGLDESQRLRNRDVELGLSGLAPGSLYIGLKVKTPVDEDGQSSLLGEEDPLFQAARAAVRAMAVVTQHLDSSEELASEISDPQVRDAAMLAVARIAPSKQSGVKSISLSTSDNEMASSPLTPLIRRELNKQLRDPVRSNEVATIVGQVREIDLDARRFELRRLEISPGRVSMSDVRCAYGEQFAHNARAWLGQRIAVTGRIERASASGLPRLVVVETIAEAEPRSRSTD